MQATSNHRYLLHLRHLHSIPQSCHWTDIPMQSFGEVPSAQVKAFWICDFLSCCFRCGSPWDGSHYIAWFGLSRRPDSAVRFSGSFRVNRHRFNRTQFFVLSMCAPTNCSLNEIKDIICLYGFLGTTKQDHIVTSAQDTNVLSSNKARLCHWSQFLSFSKRRAVVSPVLRPSIVCRW